MADLVAQTIRVLVVDDQSSMRKIVRHLLGQVDIHDVDEAENGARALELLLDQKLPDPDVIICDLHMDEMDGLHFCQRVRMNKGLQGRHIPIIILTGDKTDMLQEAALQVGAFAVLPKPVSAPELFETISNSVGYRFAEGYSAAQAPGKPDVSAA